MTRTTSFRLTVTALAALVLALCALQPAGAAPDTEATGSPAVPATEQTYSNPLMRGTADAFSDAGLIRAKDGAWYAYATNTSLTRDSGTQHLLPMVRSTDLVHWDFIGDAFSEANHPQWAGWPQKGYWAPDVRYVDGLYYMYYSAPGSTDLDAAIGLATSTDPAGPWTDIGHPVVNFVKDDEVMEIDPMLFVDDDGSKYLYYGSFRRGGIHVVKLTADGKNVAGTSHQVVAGERGEATWVAKHDSWYYLFYSGYGCCMGDQGGGGYPVLAGRSKSPTGPFRDADGVSLAAEQPGGTIVNSFNGNSLSATGHNAVTTDQSGQQWNLVNSDYRFDKTYGGRPQSMDRLDWVDGWPTVRAGRWSSDTPQTAPATGSLVDGSFDDDADLSSWKQHGSSDWSIKNDANDNGFARSARGNDRPSLLINTKRGPRNYRAEADLRTSGSDGAAGLVFGYQRPDTYAVAWLDPRTESLRVEQRRHGKVMSRRQVELYDGFSFDSWHALSVEVRNGRANVEVAASQGDSPVGKLSTPLIKDVRAPGRIGAASTAGAGQADNLSLAELYRPVTEKVPAPVAGRKLPGYSDEFSRGDIGQGWTWTGDDRGKVAGGNLNWPTQQADLSGDDAATVLLRDAPNGDYTIETKVTLPFGGSDNARAGLIAWASKEHSLQLTPTMTGAVRQAFLWPGNDATPWPEAIQLGPSADTMWLRLRHTTQPATGEHLFQAATSLDGRHWQWGSSWYLPTNVAQLKFGLVSMGGTGPTARFDYVRVYRG